MEQKSLLLQFKSQVKEVKSNVYSNYNYVKGLWENDDGTSVIVSLLKEDEVNFSGETLLTRTFEGIDRSEIS